MRCVLAPASLTLLNVAGKEDHDGMEVRTGEASHPVIRMAGAGGADDAGAGCHALAELLGEGRERGLINAERSKAVPRKSDAYPSGVRLVGLEACSGADFIEQAFQPRAASCGALKGEEFISRCERARAPHQEMLNIVELKHCHHSLKAVQLNLPQACDSIFQSSPFLAKVKVRTPFRLAGWPLNWNESVAERTT